MKTRIHPLFFVATLSLAGITFTQAADQYWNPSPLSDDWANSVWSATSGGGSLTTWTASNNAIFDQAGTYTATINAAQTATNLNIKAGTVTFAGTNTVSSTAITIDSGATLNTVGDRIAKSGTTSVTVNGTLDLTAGGFGGGRYIQLGGNGTVIGGFRHSGTASFSGNIQDVSPTVRAAILWNGGTGGTLTLSGNNTGMSGDVLMSIANSVIKLNSANAFSPSSHLRFSGSANSNLIELAAADFTPAWYTGSNAEGKGGVSWTGTNAGFYATGGDRNLTFVTTTGGTTAASLVWGSNGLTSSTVVLGAAASTHKITWTNDINLNAATRTINTTNGSAVVEAEISGVLSGTGASLLTKTGTGVLLLSNANTHAGGTTIAQSQGAINPLRISNGSALGTGSLTIGGGGGNDQSRLELTGGITVTNSVAAMTSRSNFLPSIINISGNNTMATNLSSGGGGSRITFQSDSDRLTLSGSVGVRSPIFTGSGDFLVSGNITSPATYRTLTKEGTGTLILSGASNTTETLTTITAGVLQIGNAGTSGTLGSAPVTNNASLVFNRSDSFSVSNAITGSGSLTKQGAGILSLGGTNDYSGGTSVTAGGLTFLNTSAKPASGTTTAVAGTTLGLGVSSEMGFFGSSDVNALFSGSLANVTNDVDSFVGIDTSAGDFDHTEAITSSTRGLNKLGTNTLTLSTANAYTGVTRLSAGTISVASLGDGGVSGNLGAATSDASNIVFAGGALQFSAASAASSNRGFTINTGGSATFNVSDAAGALTMTGSVPTTTGVLFKTGVGSLTLDPGAVSQSLGALSANGGELTLKSGTYATTAKDSTTSPNLSAYNIGAGARGGTLTIDGATLNVGGGSNLKIAATTGGSLNILSGTVTSNDLVIGHNGSGVATQSGGTVSVTNLYHQDSGAGSSFTLTGGELTARRIYNNTSSTADFTLNLNGGTLKSATDTANLIDNQNTGTQIAVLLGAGNTIIDTTASNASIVRPMGDMPSVAGAFTKAGTNTLTLTEANTYTGATTINGGTLTLSATGSIDNSAQIIVGDTGSSGAVLDVSAKTGGFTVGSTQTLSGIGTVDANDAGTLRTVTIEGTHAVGNSPGSQTIDGHLSYSGASSIFEWDLNATNGADPGAVPNNGSYDQVSVTGDLGGAGAVFKVVLGTNAFADAFWDTGKTWSDIFTVTGSATDLSTIFTTVKWFENTTEMTSLTAARGSFSVTGSTLTWTAVPEPTSALAGILLGFGLLRRRR